MFELWPAIAYFAASMIFTAVLTRLILGELLRRKIFDRPNSRSSHWGLVPKGGGIAVVLVVLAGWIAVGAGPGGGLVNFWLLAATVVLAAVSWADDLNGLPAAVRLVTHVGVVSYLLSVGVWRVPLDGGMGLLVLAGAGFLWVWFVNLYNFMDGIDGITGVQTITIGGGVALLAALGVIEPSVGLKAVVVAGAGAGFLIWNWHRARIFLGDVGSVPLGFLTGWLLLMLVQAGQWPAAIILPLYYLADSGLTLMRRALRGEPVWKAHNQHAYQRALPPKGGHDRIVLAIAAANVGLVALAVVSLIRPIAALLVAAVVVGGLLWHLEARAARNAVRRQE